MDYFLQFGNIWTFFAVWTILHVYEIDQKRLYLQKSPEFTSKIRLNHNVLALVIHIFVQKSEKNNNENTKKKTGFTLNFLSSYVTFLALPFYISMPKIRKKLMKRRTYVWTYNALFIEPPSRSKTLLLEKDLGKNQWVLYPLLSPTLEKHFHFRFIKDP